MTLKENTQRPKPISTTRYQNHSGGQQKKISEMRWTEIPDLVDSEALEDLLYRKLTITRVAEEVGCTRFQVIRAMKAHGIERKQFIVSEKMKEKLRI